MSCQEQQEEELEVLKSIYEGDDCFKEISPTTFQYKYGEENSNTSFVLEISWGETYPETPPTVNMDTFYNKHILDCVKKKICDGVYDQADQFLDSAMTYTLFEWVKENYDDLIADQLNIPQVVTQVNEKEETTPDSPELSKKKEKKEQLTKHQKRRLYEKMGNATGEKPRGWNWVDVVKHLSQTGSQQQE